MIRIARVEDAARIREIYSYYVENTAITFEVEVPTVEEFENRISRTLRKYPYFVYEDEGKIVGYTYASPYKFRKAYDWAVETSIYVDKDYRKGGIGRKLYDALEYALRLMHITNMNACIGYPTENEKYVTRASEQFHEHLGFIPAARFHNVAYKFDQWFDVIWMEKFLQEHPEKPKEKKDFEEIRDLL